MVGGLGQATAYSSGSGDYSCSCSSSRRDTVTEPTARLVAAQGARQPAVLAPVLCQPSLPLDAPAAIESPPEELAAVRARLERENLTVLAYRFAGDAVCRAERFAAYERALGDRFQPRTLPDTAARREGLSPFFARHVPTPHSVVTAHLIDEAGQPTLAARDEILAFFADRLT